MKKSAKIVLLPTEKAKGPISRRNDLGQSEQSPKEGFLQYDANLSNICRYNPYWDSHNLYVISDEEIKVGDWCINKNQDTLYQIKEILAGGIEMFWSKIIATTDPELWYNKHFDCNGQGCSICDKLIIAKLPSDFIKAYIKAYNEGKPITDIMVEYEEKYFARVKDAGEWTSLDSYAYRQYTQLSHVEGKTTDMPKLRPDNTIIISKVKEQTFTIEDMYKAYFAGGQNAFSKKIGLNYTQAEDAMKWLNENYSNK